MSAEEFIPYINLLSSIVYQGIVDKDEEFLRSDVCYKYCSFIGVNHKSMLEWLDKKDKDTKFYPEYFLKFNFSENYKRCSKCLHIKYITSFTTLGKTESSSGSICLACTTQYNKAYYAKKRA